MKSTSKIIVAIVAAGSMAMGAAALAASGAGDCGSGHWTARDGHRGVRFDPAARADQRLARLKAELKITPAQEPLWQAFAGTVKGEAGKGLRAMRKQAKDENLTAPERMTRMTEIMKQRLVAMESVGDAFNHLYQGLTPEQRKLADEQATRMARLGFGGHRGAMRHHHRPPVDSTKG